MIQGRWEERLATFKSPTVETEDGDTTLDPFVEDFQSWIRIQPTSSVEEAIGDQVQTAQVGLITMRHDSRVRERMQVHLDGRVMEIVSKIDPDSRGIELQLGYRELV